MPYCVLDFSRVPYSVLKLPAAERANAIIRLVETTENAADLAPHITGTTPMNSLAEMAVVSILLGSGGTLMILPMLIAYAVKTGSFRLLTALVVLLTALAAHPIPLFTTGRPWLLRSRALLVFFQYFSFRVVWTGEPDLRERERTSGNPLPQQCCPVRICFAFTRQSDPWQEHR